MSDHSRSEEQEVSASPPSLAGRPRREGNDSLWKRARRTLGTQNLTFLQPQSRPPGSNASASGSGPAAPSKRREQVRHAQRTHRQRTQNYIKTLESEVVRLRESGAKLMMEKEDLQSQVQVLKVTLVSANLPMPPRMGEDNPTMLPDPVSDFDLPATVSYLADDFDHQRLHVQWPNAPAQTPMASYSQDPSQPFYTQAAPQPYRHHGGNRPTADFPNDIPFESLSVSPSPHPRVASSSQPPVDVKTSAIIDTIETAIDFVLSLEHPCMTHIPYPGDEASADPANHMMMVSTPLMARSPESPKQNSVWTTSGAIINQLLNLSGSINLDGEMTPVQAWHTLHQHADFWRLDKPAMEQLKRQLSTTVKCYGFGAVLDENVFWHYLNAALAPTAPGSA